MVFRTVGHAPQCCCLYQESGLVNKGGAITPNVYGLRYHKGKDATCDFISSRTGVKSRHRPPSRSSFIQVTFVVEVGIFVLDVSVKVPKTKPTY